MTDRAYLVTRLRIEGENKLHQQYSLGMWKLCQEAADEIERLEAEVVQLKREAGY